MNIFKGVVDHQVKFWGADKGPLKSSAPKRPVGMSGRQWKKARKAARRFVKAAPGESVSLAQ